MTTTTTAPADQSTGQPGLALVTCPDWTVLCDRLVEGLRRPPADPFAPQTVVVEDPATRRALAQELAVRLGSATGDHNSGICAGIDFVSLQGLRRRLESELLGLDPARDPWRRRALTLAVVEVLAEAKGDWFAPLAAHLGDDDSLRPGRRIATAQRIARLLHRYLETTPELLESWRRGELVDAEGQPLADSQIWQAMVWQALLERLPAPDPLSRRMILAERLREQPTGAPLHVVDPTTARPSDEGLVRALADAAPVTVLFLDARRGDELLDARWAGVRNTWQRRWQEVADSVEQLGPQGRTALVDVRVEVHASHGPDRQVEVLREVLCRLFDDDPTLEPRDVAVACTDLAHYAPLVRASFGLDESLVGRRLHPGHRLRVQLASSSLAQPNPVFDLLRQLLELAGDRATAQQLVDLCASSPVAALFGLEEDHQERIRRLVDQAEVRWGLDGSHRAAFGLGQVRQSTWLAGVERILTGIAMGAEPLQWLGTALPLEQVDGSDVTVAGQLAEIVSRVRKLVAQWRQPATVEAWVERLQEALGLLAAEPSEQGWQLAAARRQLADLAELAATRTALLRTSDVRALFDELLQPGRGRPNHGSGALLVCALGDLGLHSRRVVVVLGLDDSRFPARPARDGDDLTRAARDPRTDARARSRQLLLDATLAATERLVVVHQGRSARTNEGLPQPVALLDLVEAADRHHPVASEQHSLLPQAEQNFLAGSPRSFDVEALAGARARRDTELSPPPPALPLWQQQLGAPGVAMSSPDPAQLDPAQFDPVQLDLAQLVDFWRHPARELLRHQLGTTMTDWERPLAEELPAETTGLEQWAIGDRLVRLALEGVDLGRASTAERLRGALPPGQLGNHSLDSLLPVVQRVVRSVQRCQGDELRDLDCELELDAAVLTGRVRVHGGQIVHHSFSRTSATHLLESWCELLLVAATQPAPSTGWRAVHVGRDAMATLLAPPPEWCRQHLTEMVALWQRGLHQLVPLPPKAAATWVGLTPLRPFRDHDPVRKAADEFRFEHDADWGRFVTDDLTAVRELPRRDGDPGPTGTSRFENLADWMFAPLRGQLNVGNLR
ncbi:exodeoxyribonuclease V subunit gamma [Luteococcus sediminum]